MADRLENSVPLLRALSVRSWTYAEIEEHFGKSRRTATRWIQSVRHMFPEALTEDFRPDGRKAFRLRVQDSWFLKLTEPQPDELAALDGALGLLKRERMMAEHDRLEALRGKLRNLLDERGLLARYETDLEAMHDAVGLGFRPGPRTTVETGVREVLRAALLKQHRVEFTYHAPGKPPSRKRVGPYGLLFGRTERLAGVAEGRDLVLQFRLDRMTEVRELDDEPFVPPENGFRDYCLTLFASFGEPPFDVEWRFHPSAPEVERWQFHPGQRIERKPDGSVVVRFRAGGKEDMARHLVGWWDWVERIRPRELRRTVLRMRLAGLAPLVEEFADRETADRIRELAGELGATQVTSAGESGPGR